MESKSELNKWVLCGLISVACAIMGYFYGDSSVRKEAVKHNVARWFAEENGAPKFGWGQ